MNSLNKMATTYTPGMDGIEYDLHRYQSAAQRVRDARKEIDKLPTDVMERVLRIASNIAEGMLGASEAITNPIMDTGKRDLVKSTLNDYHTDMKGLDELPELFKKP